MSELRLDDFVACDDVRTYLKAPFQIDGYACATNNHVLLADRRGGSASDNELPSGMESTVRGIIEEAMVANMRPFPVVETPAPVPCYTCKGTGNATVDDCRECDGRGEAEASTEYNIYDVECKSCCGEGREIKPGTKDTCPDCNGTGEMDCAQPVKIESMWIDNRYLSLIKDVPGVTVCASSDGKKLLFSAGHYFGAIMALTYT